MVFITLIQGSINVSKINEEDVLIPLVLIWSEKTAYC